jgi:hypothetical protein
MTPPVHSKNNKAKSFKASLTQEERWRLADLNEKKKAMQKHHKQAKMEATKQRRFSKLEHQNEAIKRRGEPSTKEDLYRTESDNEQQQEPIIITEQQQEPIIITEQQQEPATTTNADIIEIDSE